MKEGMRTLLEMHNSDELRFLTQAFDFDEALTREQRLAKLDADVLVDEVSTRFCHAPPHPPRLTSESRAPSRRTCVAYVGCGRGSSLSIGATWARASSTTSLTCDTWCGPTGCEDGTPPPTHATPGVTPPCVG